MNSDLLLSVDNLTVSFTTRNGYLKAVDNLSFTLARGKMLGIVGESGSGKSVSCYSMLGLIPMPPGKVESGRVLFAGENLLALSEAALRKIRGQKIAMIFQDPMTSLNPGLTIAEQLIEPLIVHKKMARDKARLQAIRLLEEVGIEQVESRIDNYPHQFSGGMRQRVMIAMALIAEPELLIADEPTTALDVTVQAQILALIKNLQVSRGLSVIFITHDLAVAAQITDDVLVMKAGQVVESGKTVDVFHHPQHGYTKKLLSSILSSTKKVNCELESRKNNFLVVNQLTTSYLTNQRAHFLAPRKRARGVTDISFTVRQGEILGIVGESGSGKSTLGKTIMQLLESDTGEIWLEGKNISSLSGNALKMARTDFQMIFQDPYASLNPRMTVFDTLAEPLKLFKSANSAELNERVNRLMDDVGLDRAFIRKYPHEFSGGQRQRIAIARALALEPKLIIADEPVSALDVTIRAQILELLLSITRKRNLTLLFISHDMSVVRYLCDRVLVMKEGKIVEEGSTQTIFTHPQADYTKALLSAIPALTA